MEKSNRYSGNMVLARFCNLSTVSRIKVIQIQQKGRNVVFEDTVDNHVPWKPRWICYVEEWQAESHVELDAIYKRNALLSHQRRTLPVRALRDLLFLK